MRPIDADELLEHLEACLHNGRPLSNLYDLSEIVRYVKSMPTIAASQWHRVEDNPPDEKKDVIFYYEWIGIDGTVHKPTSVISLDTLIALDCRPIAWMEKPEPPKEDADANK